MYHSLLILTFRSLLRRLFGLKRHSTTFVEYKIVVYEVDHDIGRRRSSLHFALLVVVDSLNSNATQLPS